MWATQLADGFLSKILKYLEIMFNIFEFSKNTVESCLVYLNKFS